MGLDFILGAAGVGCYVVAAVLALATILSARPLKERTTMVVMAVGAVALAAILAMRLVRAEVLPAFNRFDALTCYALALTSAYYMLMLTRPARGISGLLVPYAAAVLLFGIPAFGVDPGPPPPFQGWRLGLHVALAFCGYALLSLASVLAAAYLLQDSNLKHKRLGRVWERLPALETLDHLMGRLVGMGFLLFTGAILLGITLARQSGDGENWLMDPKVGATAVTWILFAVLVHMRASADRHGRGMAVVTIAGLACLMFTFIGVHLLADSVHGFLRILPAY